MKELIKDFNQFIKSHADEFEILEQGSFIRANTLDIKKISNDLMSSDFNSLYKAISSLEISPIVDRIRVSDFALNDKKNMLLLLLASKGERYYQTLHTNISEIEKRYLMTYLYKLECFLNLVNSKTNKSELGLFLYDHNAFRKYLKGDDFLMPIKLSNVFNWAKKDLDNEQIKANLNSSIKALYKSRRKLYPKLNLFNELIKNYKSYEVKFNDILKSL